MATLLLIPGCSSTTEGAASPGTKTSTTVAAPTTPWDPCTIPDEAVERAGLNVATKESGIFGRDQYGFKICGWEDRPPNNKYYFSIFVGLEGIDYLDDPATFDRLQAVRVGTRDATQYQQVGADASLNCGIAFTEGIQLIRATIITDATVRNPPYDPCMELNSLVAGLDSELPS
ncbi:DUF3558 family protein [Rhodococcus sp. IEGM 1381]|uniref:DUF3558 family protein n=1 Tax=Rhodococcus sp. IEGM 1381 TaxID=3047085 RepID=UPI0024B6B082|nr:DUF3558 family protein [Rhodococcus sp. IEGM 1381]MDI9893506.1 DUF3558 family protein [Rhodococcus sp. IEGM 1381]